MAEKPIRYQPLDDRRVRHLLELLRNRTIREIGIGATLLALALRQRCAERWSCYG